jgi:BON domain-containing protein
MKRNWTVGVLTLLTLVAGPAFARETTVSNHFAQEKVKEGAAQAKDAVVQGAKATAKGTKEVLSKTGEVITDGWITTRVNARFVNEDLLKDSDVTVDTDDHVVTLTGTVMSPGGSRQGGTHRDAHGGRASLCESLDHRTEARTLNGGRRPASRFSHGRTGSAVQAMTTVQERIFHSGRPRTVRESPKSAGG